MLLSNVFYLNKVCRIVDLSCWLVLKDCKITAAFVVLISGILILALLCNFFVP